MKMLPEFLKKMMTKARAAASPMPELLSASEIQGQLQGTDRVLVRLRVAPRTKQRVAKPNKVPTLPDVKGPKRKRDDRDRGRAAGGGNVRTFFCN